VYLGIDVGSISTNVVLIDDKMNVVDREYLMTAGRPLEAIKQGLKAVGGRVGDKVRVVGAGTTGSGRYLTGDFIGADVVRNEITAQATAAAAIDPRVDTIFEIGGQDSKFISLENGAIVDFMMNKVCAAGTGSFLEEQAEKLGISIKGEFGDIALSAEKPVQLGERCTVFMESDLVHYQQQGVDLPDLVGGLCYSIVINYINKVVEDRRVGDHIFYQGATAFNQGIVAAFEKVTGKKITVPNHADVTGAIGVAWLAKQERDLGSQATSRASTCRSAITKSVRSSATAAPTPAKSARSPWMANDLCSTAPGAKNTTFRRKRPPKPTFPTCSPNARKCCSTRRKPSPWTAWSGA
jgi:predicted CoA-substrate-specific enzyme activase